MSWRDHSDDKDCDLYQVLYRDDGVASAACCASTVVGLPAPTRTRAHCCTRVRARAMTRPGLGSSTRPDQGGRAGGDARTRAGN
jgi:hypothetical protein